MAFLDYSGLQRFKSKLDVLFNDKLSTSLKGAANGLAELDSAGKVPSSQLPSFVDDVLEYASLGNFPLTGESGKIYVALDTNKIYRWSGSAYVEISSSLALGETSSTAYRGDRGKAAYDHATAKGSAFTSGLYKITTNAQGHVTAATAVAKSDITGLGIPGSDTNTHRPIQVNGTEVLGNNTTALNLKAGSNVSVTNSSGTVTISATDTTYSSKTASSGGTDVSLVTTGEKYTWNNKASSDTKNTTGTTNKTGTKMFIAAATEQSANPTTYSNSNVYIGTDNCLYSGGAKVLTAHQNISGKKNTQSAVSDPSASGTSVTFIATLSQNAQGVISPTKKTVRTMSGASSSAAGSTGLVPAPASGDQNKYLKGDGSWDEPAGTIGEIRMFSGSTPPDKWKFCDGSLVSRTTYADLFSVLGTAFGGGDGRTTFALPNFKGRTPVGAGESSATGHTAHTLGQMAGEERHTLLVTELASHSHQIKGYRKPDYGGSTDIACAAWEDSIDASGGAYTRGNGSNTAHNTMQPYTGINFIIYTGVDSAA